MCFEKFNKKIKSNIVQVNIKAEMKIWYSPSIII